MGDKSAIEWCDATWNPVVGCTRISPGCDHCYALTVHNRRHKAWLEGKWPDAPEQYHMPFEQVQLLPERLTVPLRWRRPRRVFVNSLADLFHQGVPDEFIDRVFAAMALSPQHTFQVLTKRPRRMHDYASGVEVGGTARAIQHTTPRGNGILDAIRKLSTPYRNLTRNYSSPLPGLPFTWPLPNVWLGVSVELGRFAWRAEYLRRTPAAVRFISAEPLLGPLDALDLAGIDWVIAGGESGGGARPMHPDWPRGLRDRCVGAGVAYFFQQWGEWAPVELDPDTWHDFVDADGKIGQCRRRADGTWSQEMRGPSPAPMRLLGKHKAGRLLDGHSWDEFPRTVAAGAAS